MKTNKNGFWLTFFLTAAVFSSGCGGSYRRDLDVEYVEGTVMLDGELLSDASVQFIPKEEVPGIEAAGGHTDKNGKYRLSSMNGDPGKGALEGDYNVFISKVVSVPIPGAKIIEGEPPPEEIKYLSPQKYSDFSKPLLEAEVKKGKNVFHFKLEK